jgi:hypothetical protein
MLGAQPANLGQGILRVRVSFLCAWGWCPQVL